MKTKEILKQLYYALIIAGLLIFWYATLNSMWLNNNRFLSFCVLLSLGICWVMTRHNKPSTFKWYAGIIIALTLLYIYMPMLLSSFVWAWGDLSNILRHILIIGCLICAVISTFLSNTKYYNILPNQSKGISRLFRGLSWTGQFIVWGCCFLALLSAIGVIH